MREIQLIKVHDIYGREYTINRDDLNTGRELIPLYSIRKRCKVSMLNCPPDVTMIAVQNIIEIPQVGDFVRGGAGIVGFVQSKGKLIINNRTIKGYTVLTAGGKCEFLAADDIQILNREGYRVE